MIKTLTALVILSALISCEQSSNRATIENSKLTFDATKYAIVPYDTNLLGQSSLKDLIKSNLSFQELVKVDSLVKLAVYKYNTGGGAEKNLASWKKGYEDEGADLSVFKIDLANFKRQIYAVTYKNKEKTVWLNCFREFDDDYGQKSWKKHIIQAEGGGMCYIQLHVNLTKDTFSEITINDFE